MLILAAMSAVFHFGISFAASTVSDTLTSILSSSMCIWPIFRFSFFYKSPYFLSCSTCRLPSRSVKVSFPFSFSSSAFFRQFAQ